ncbi:hypothetical protein [Pseudomonas putida]|uniref:hypothetical protein n=1 Tax=Pseudomonas putida TaxID=303 RepID=UPI0002F85AB5|nr:hypothetical protein [Pseudomonas putida]
MSDETFDVAAFAAQATGTTGISDDAGLDQVVPDRLADDLDAYADHAQQRDQHLTTDDDDPDGADQVDPTGLKNKSVPLGALQEERMRRKEAQDQAAQLQQQFAALQQQQAAIQQYLAQQQQARHEAQIPSLEDDPVGHLEGVKQQMANELGQMRQQLQAQQYEQQARAEMAALAPSVTASEAAMCEEIGEDGYRGAYEFMQQRAHEQLVQTFPGATPQQLARMRDVAGVLLAKQCQLQGVDVARYIVEKAQALGFNPGHRVPGQERKAPPTSLSNIPAAGRAPDQRGRLTAKDIATMPQDEFDAMFESMRRGCEQWPV